MPARPWEIGLAETHQTLVANRLRGRIAVQVDGGIRTGRDVVVGALLGADEFGFATAPLIAAGCIMMRKCHLNTCPVGVATQDPVLRKRFTGQPEHVINYFFFVAEEVRELMAAMGYPHLRRDDRPDADARPAQGGRALEGEGPRLLQAVPQAGRRRKASHIYKCEPQDHKIDDILDRKLIAEAQAALDRGAPVRIADRDPQHRPHRRRACCRARSPSATAMPACPTTPSTCSFTGTAGQSFGAWLARGVTFELEGEANDYVGKGLSGGRIIVRPPADAGIVPEESIIVGNTVLYGAIDGECYFRGVAGERFAVRNSGAIAVVEGAGDHCCEYMTGGVVVVLGRTGRNFAAGMSGGIAYVLDEDGTFETRCNMAMVELEPVPDEEEISRAASITTASDLEAHGRVDVLADMTRYDAERLHLLIARHARFTGSKRAAEILADWKNYLPEVPQGDAGRISPRARRDGEGEGRARCRRRNERMGKVTGFLEFEREDRDYAAGRGAHQALARIRPAAAGEGNPRPGRALHGLRHSLLPRHRLGCTGAPTGCPVNNQIPDWNDLVYRGNWEEAARNLHSTNNFPEFTGRVCPAPCEASCTLNIDDNPVTIKTIECAIADRACEQGWVKPEPPPRKTGKKVAVVGSGPAGWPARSSSRAPATTCTSTRSTPRPAACCATAFPTSRWRSIHVDRRVAQMEAEGVTFHYGAHVGVNVPAEKLLDGLRRGGARPAAPRSRAICRSRAASSTASISPWISCRSRTGASAASRTATSSRSSPAASMSWSSAAATPAPTASAPRSARARCR